MENIGPLGTYGVVQIPADCVSKTGNEDHLQDGFPGLGAPQALSEMV